MSICAARQAESQAWGAGSYERAMAAAMHLNTDGQQENLPDTRKERLMHWPEYSIDPSKDVSPKPVLATDYSRPNLPSCRADMAFVRWVYGRTWPAASHGIYALPDGRITMQLTWHMEAESGHREDGRMSERAVRLSKVSGPSRRHILDAYAALEEEEGPRECGIMDNRPWLDEKEPESSLSRLYRD